MGFNFGSFAGGVAQGGMKTYTTLKDQERLDKEQEQRDYDFAQRKAAVDDANANKLQYQQTFGQIGKESYSGGLQKMAGLSPEQAAVLNQAIQAQPADQQAAYAQGRLQDSAYTGTDTIQPTVMTRGQATQDYAAGFRGTPEQSMAMADRAETTARQERIKNIFAQGEVFKKDPVAAATALSAIHGTVPDGVQTGVTEINGKPHLAVLNEGTRKVELHDISDPETHNLMMLRAAAAEDPTYMKMYQEAVQNMRTNKQTDRKNDQGDRAQTTSEKQQAAMERYQQGQLANDGARLGLERERVGIARGAAAAEKSRPLDGKYIQLMGTDETGPRYGVPMMGAGGEVTTRMLPPGYRPPQEESKGVSLTAGGAYMKNGMVTTLNEKTGQYETVPVAQPPSNKAAASSIEAMFAKPPTAKQTQSTKSGGLQPSQSQTNPNPLGLSQAELQSQLARDAQYTARRQAEAAANADKRAKQAAVEKAAADAYAAEARARKDSAMEQARRNLGL